MNLGQRQIGLHLAAAGQDQRQRVIARPRATAFNQTGR
jgi:hypothetical protein